MLALKNLLRRKARSLFCVLQIAVAIAAFVSIVGVTQGLRAQFYRIGQVFAFDLIVMRQGAPSPLFSAVPPSAVEQIKAVEGVRAASPMASTNILKVQSGSVVISAEPRPSIWAMADASKATGCGGADVSVAMLKPSAAARTVRSRA